MRPLKWSGWFLPTEKWKEKGIYLECLLFPPSLTLNNASVTRRADKYIYKKKGRPQSPLDVRINKFDILNGLERVNMFPKGAGIRTASLFDVPAFNTGVLSPCPTVD